MAELGIHYLHCKELAPTRQTREQQYAADKVEGTTKRQRTALSQAFAEAYQGERLAAFDSALFMAGLGPEAKVIALFCVEREPQACHRSLVAERLARDLGARVKHITP